MKLLLLICFIIMANSQDSKPLRNVLLDIGKHFNKTILLSLIKFFFKKKKKKGT